MKVIATRNDRQYGSDPDTFIVEVSLLEIQKVANKAGYQQWKPEDTKKLLSPGMEYDLGAGFDFRSEIVSATSAMKGGLEKFVKATDTMHRFVDLIQQQEPTA